MSNERLQNLEGSGTDLHEEILSQGRDRFPEESFRQLLAAGANPLEALRMLGYPRVIAGQSEQ